MMNGGRFAPPLARLLRPSAFAVQTFNHLKLLLHLSENVTNVPLSIRRKSAIVTALPYPTDHLIDEIVQRCLVNDPSDDQNQQQRPQQFGLPDDYAERGQLWALIKRGHGGLTFLGVLPTSVFAFGFVFASPRPVRL